VNLGELDCKIYSQTERLELPSTQVFKQQENTMKDKTTSMYISYTLIRKEYGTSDLPVYGSEYDDTSWTDEVHVASEIKTWLEDLDFTVEDMHIKTFITGGNNND
tara:strand:- start:34 stop:348 length:315 start_codon:yes stop_codon:yes gene_type:complete